MASIKRAKEWLTNLPIEQQRQINKDFKKYADETSVIYRMGKDEWMLNKYSMQIDEWVLDINKKSNEEQGQLDTVEIKQQVETHAGMKDTYLKSGGHEGIEQQPDIEPSDSKERLMKIALIIFVAGALGVIL
jgi:hypothetical protein